MSSKQKIHYDERDGISIHQTLDCLRNRLFKAQIKENVKAPRHWLLWWEFTGDRWIPRKGPVTRKMFQFFMTSSWDTCELTWHFIYLSLYLLHFVLNSFSTAFRGPTIYTHSVYTVCTELLIWSRDLLNTSLWIVMNRSRMNPKNSLDRSTEILILPGIDERIRPRLGPPQDGSCPVDVHQWLACKSIVHEAKYCCWTHGQKIYPRNQSHHLDNLPVCCTCGRIWHRSSIRVGYFCWSYLSSVLFLLLPCHCSDHTVTQDEASDETDELREIQRVVNQRV